MPAEAGGGDKVVVISPQVDFDSPPALLIGGGLFFLMSHDTWGWALILLGTILAAKAYESAAATCRNN